MTSRETFTATVPSNSGRAETELRFTELGSEVLELSFTFVGTSWASDSSDFTEEHGAHGGPVRCSKASVLELGAGLERWLQSGELFSWDSGAEGSLLTLSLCRPEELITRVDKPAFAGTYRDSASFRSSWIYVVDQSCLRATAAVIQEVAAPRQVH